MSFLSNFQCIPGNRRPQFAIDISTFSTLLPMLWLRCSCKLVKMLSVCLVYLSGC